MSDDRWLGRLRRTEIALGLVLAAVSFAPWWTRRADGSAASAWSGPHFTWLAVLLCLTVVAVRALGRPRLGDRWAAAGIVVAAAVAGWGWLAELTAPSAGSDQLAWVLQDQGAAVRPVGGAFEVGWGYGVGLCLMALLFAGIAAAARRGRDG